MKEVDLNRTLNAVEAYCEPGMTDQDQEEMEHLGTEIKQREPVLEAVNYHLAVRAGFL